MVMPLLTVIIAICGMAVLVSVICYRLRVPSIVGFLVTGVLTGPHLLGVVDSVESVEALAEIGVVSLLFTIGLEFSLRRLQRLRPLMLTAGTVQLVLTTAAVALAAHYIGYAFGPALLCGLVISLSSTAVTLTLLQRRAELESPSGRACLAVLIYQDIMAVPMMLGLPLLAGKTPVLGSMGLAMIGKTVGILFVVLVAAKWGVRWLLSFAASSRDREVFLLCVIFVCLGVAWLTSAAGLSLALGAFLAGLIIAESDYHHRALGSVLSLRDVFTSFFFVSVGMMLDLRIIVAQAALFISATFAVLLLKLITGAIAALAAGLPPRIAVMTGAGLCQVGEFSFVLLQASSHLGLLDPATYQVLLGVSILTLLVSPFAMTGAPWLAEHIARLPLLRRLEAVPRGDSTAEDDHAVSDHIIIIGFGFNGANLARAARNNGIEYVICELNPATVQRERARGEPIHYGDSTHEATLRHLRIDQARCIVIAISDIAATRRITGLARFLNPEIRIIARTRFVSEVPELERLGADEVIPEEFETAITVFERALAAYDVPEEDIANLAADVRAGNYEVLRQEHMDDMADEASAS